MSEICTAGSSARRRVVRHRFVGRIEPLIHRLEHCDALLPARHQFDVRSPVVPRRGEFLDLVEDWLLDVDIHPENLVSLAR